MGSISIKKVLMKFDNNIVIDNLDEEIYDGELYALIGSSGSGKTTLLKIIAGLALINGGEVLVNGKNILKFSQNQMLDYHKICGFVFQNSALISNMSIYENLSLYYNYHTNMTEKEIYEKIKYFLDYVGYNDDLTYRPNVLSFGEKMLINIIRAIFHNPEFIFWDNPLASLDSIYQRKVKNIIIDLKKQKKTMVLVTNDFDFAFSVADKVGVLAAGKILESGTPDEIRSSRLKFTKELICKE
jgi:ABC-type multidrug transport system ATPase subunit